MNEHREGPIRTDEDALLRRWFAASSRSRRVPSTELLARRGSGRRGRRTYRRVAAVAVAIVVVIGGIASVGTWAGLRTLSGSTGHPSAPTSAGSLASVSAVFTPPHSAAPTTQDLSGPSLAQHEYVVQMHLMAGGGWLLTGSRLLLMTGRSGWDDCWVSAGGVFNAPYPYALVAGLTIRVFAGATLWTSTDGCATWARSPVPVLVTGAAFPTDNTGYIAYVDLSNQTPTAEIYRTDDGGGHWTATPGKVEGAPGPGGSAFSGLLSMAFADADHGWLTDGHALWTTADGGGSWTRTTLPVPASVHGQPDVIAAPAVGADGSAVVVAKYDATPGMDGAPGQQVFFRSVDRGVRWSAAAVMTDPGMLKISLVDPSTWVVLNPSDPAVLQTTTDSGSTWQTVIVRELWPYNSGPIDFADALHGWMVVSEPEPPCPPSVAPTNMSVACDYAYPTQHLVSTDDGGATWVELKP